MIIYHWANIASYLEAKCSIRSFLLYLYRRAKHLSSIWFQRYLVKSETFLPSGRTEAIQACHWSVLSRSPLTIPSASATLPVSYRHMSIGQDESSHRAALWGSSLCHFTSLINIRHFEWELAHSKCSINMWIHKYHHHLFLKSNIYWGHKILDIFSHLEFWKKVENSTVFKSFLCVGGHFKNVDACLLILFIEQKKLLSLQQE